MSGFCPANEFQVKNLSSDIHGKAALSLLSKVNKRVPAFAKSNLCVSLVLAVRGKITPYVNLDGTMLNLTAQLAENETLNPGDGIRRISAARPVVGLEETDDDILNIVSEMGASLGCAKFTGYNLLFFNFFVAFFIESQTLSSHRFRNNAS